MPALIRDVEALRRHTWVLVLGILVCDVGVLLLKASTQPLWFDELVTFYVSQLQPASRTSEALRAGLDTMPIGYYILVRLANALPFDHHLTVRLPSIVGYLLSLLAVFWFARKRLCVVAGLTAILILALSPFREYAVEARSYALVVGLLAISAVLWQKIGERRFMAPLLTLSLALAVACHYYAVTALSIFGVAELAWSVVSRRVRWSVWTGCILASSPFFLTLPVLLHLRDMYGANFWALPSWSNMLGTYGLYTGFSFAVNLALLALLGLVIVGTIYAKLIEPSQASREDGFSAPEMALVGGFLFYPVFLVTLTNMASRAGYTSRYGWPAILGLALGSVYLVRSNWSERACHYLLCALLLAFVVQDVATLGTLSEIEAGREWAQLAAVSRIYPDLPVVIGDPLEYLKAVEYAPEPLRTQVMLVETAAEPNQHENPAEKFLPWRQLYSVPFLSSHPTFLLYGGVGRFDLFTKYLIDNGYDLRTLARERTFSIFLVKR